MDEIVAAELGLLALEPAAHAQGFEMNAVGIVPPEPPRLAPPQGSTGRRRAHQDMLALLRRHGLVAAAVALEDLCTFNLDVATRAERLTAWADLPQTTTLRAHEAAGQVCAITLDLLADIAEPIVIRTGRVVHVYSFCPFLEHWVVHGTDPLNRQTVRYERLLRVLAANQADSGPV